MYTHLYNIYNSLKVYDIVNKINDITCMFRSRNNVLPKNSQLLYKAKYYIGNLFNRITI